MHEHLQKASSELGVSLPHVEAAVAASNKTLEEARAIALAHLKKVVGYTHRHLAQRPNGDITETKWRYSLMNWGHDPSTSA